MNLEEIEKLTDVALGAALDAEIGFDSRPEFRNVSYPILCQNLDEIAKVERIVIEKVGKYDYGEAIINVCGMSGLHLTGVSLNGICEIATADARTRATACLLALSKFHRS